jgi:exodeoxyribonuclease-5
MARVTPDIILTKEQDIVLKAIFQWLDDRETPYLVVGGYAGTGKTTLIAHLRREMAGHRDWKKTRVAFCSYTGKATAVLRQKLKDAAALFSQDSCSTIHSLIYKPVLDEAGRITGWERTSALLAELIIIDEGSMVNGIIWNDLRSFGVPILVFGDHGQLPPVEGSFYLMQGAHYRLETIVRQAADNPIIQLSKAVREGHDIPFGRTGSTVVKYALQDPESWEVFESVVSRPSEEYLCVCGLNRTRVGLNKRIRQIREFEREEPQVNDRLICLKNNHLKALYNGMLGTVRRIENSPPHWYDATIILDDASEFEGKILRYQFNQQKTVRDDGMAVLPVSEKEFGELFDFGYALTVHKAQGSEADRVVVFEERMRLYDGEMWRRWLYTAVTRARESLIVFA